MAPTKEDVIKAFAKADKDRNGKLSINEFKVALTERVEDDEHREVADITETMELLMNILDTDGDKMLTCDELLKTLELENDKVGKIIMMNMIKAADKNGDGFLTVAELKELFLKWHPEDAADIDNNVDMFIKMASSDGDKKLKIEEAVRLYNSDSVEDPKEKMKTMFRMCHSDGDGSISKTELAKLMNMFEEEEFKEIINMMMVMADEDGDGKLSYDEFCILMDSTMTMGRTTKTTTTMTMIKAADKDGEGFLTALELKELFLKSNQEDVSDINKNVDMFIKMASSDGDKKLKIEEAVKLYSAEEGDPKENMKILFRMCDSDGDGSISKKELAKFMNMFDDEEYKEIINMMIVLADEDQDGKLSYDEFCNLMESTMTMTTTTTTDTTMTLTKSLALQGNLVGGENEAETGDESKQKIVVKRMDDEEHDEVKCNDV